MIVRSVSIRPVGVGAATALVLALGACAVGPDFKRPDPPAVGAYLPATSAGDVVPAATRQHVEPRSDVPAQWWTLFSSPALDAIVDEAAARSPTLVEAQATLRQSEASLRAGEGVFFPQVGVAASASRENSLTVFNRAPASSGPYTLATLGASVSYAPDLFGGQRRAVEALGARVDAQRDAYLAAYLALTANVANTAIARAGYQAQHDALADIVRMQGEQIHLATVQAESGTGTYAAALALRSQEASNRATLAALEQRIDQADHLLALLGGRPPVDAGPSRIALDDVRLPMALPGTLPSTLARHRPDVLAAEAQLHVASAEIGVATADLFPSLTLGSTGGGGHASIGDLLQAGTKFWSLQAALAVSVFNGGSQWYARRAAQAAYDAALAAYEQTVLAAMTQVADALRALEHDAVVLQADTDAEAAAGDSLRLTRINFEAGNAGYLDLLVADSQLAQSRVARLGASTQQLQDTVALYAALGGGWWNDAAPATAKSFPP